MKLRFETELYKLEPSIWLDLRDLYIDVVIYSFLNGSAPYPIYQNKKSGGRATEGYHFKYKSNAPVNSTSRVTWKTVKHA